MPRNGTTGVYTRTDGTRTGTTVWTQAKNAGVKIVSGGHDTHDQDIATALNDCLTQDNKIKPTANFIPNADGTLDLGSSSVTWNNQYLKGNLHLIDGNNDGARFYNASNYVELRAPATLAANRVFTLPNADGTSGQFLTTDGAGVTSWTSNNSAMISLGAKSLTGTDVDFTTELTSYKHFRLYLSNVQLSNTTHKVLLMLSANGSSFFTYQIYGTQNLSGTLTAYNASQAEIIPDQVGGSTDKAGAVIDIFFTQGGSTTISGQSYNANGKAITFSGNYNLASSTIGGIRLRASNAGSFSSGDAVLFGLNI